MSIMFSFLCNMQHFVFTFTAKESHILLSYSSSTLFPLSLVSAIDCKDQKWRCPVLVSTQLKRDLCKEHHTVSLRKIIETIAIPLLYSKENNTAARDCQQHNKENLLREYKDETLPKNSNHHIVHVGRLYNYFSSLLTLLFCSLIFFRIVC